LPYLASRSIIPDGDSLSFPCRRPPRSGSGPPQLDHISRLLVPSR
jgi:hypothetical protein